jgi:hypothetical protein
MRLSIPSTVRQRVLLAFITGAAIACVTAPGRNSRCVYVGDTVGVAVQIDHGRVSRCAWLIADSTACGLTEYWTKPPSRCVLGDTVPG